MMETIDHALMGMWVPKDDVRASGAALDVRPHSSSGVITAAGLIYHAHALQPGLWRAPGTRLCLHFADEHVWLRDADGAWQAYCRPGLDEVLPLPPQPVTRRSTEALLKQLHDNAEVLSFDVRDDIDADGRVRAVVRVWLNGYAEQRLWGENGVFDLCDLE
jgi:hypothetical protein